MTITKIIAQIKLGKLLDAASTILIGIEIQIGAKLRAASGDKKIANTNPRNVATNAIFKVSTIPKYAFEPHKQSANNLVLHPTKF